MNVIHRCVRAQDVQHLSPDPARRTGRSLIGDRLHPLVTYGASHLGVMAQTAAYTHGRDWVHQLVAELSDNRALLSELVEERLPGVRLVAPPSTYLAWLDFRGVGLGDDPAAVVLERGRVALSPGPTFGGSGAGFARLNFATSREILAQAVDRIAHCLD